MCPVRAGRVAGALRALSADGAKRTSSQVDRRRVVRLVRRAIQRKSRIMATTCCRQETGNMAARSDRELKGTRRAAGHAQGRNRRHAKTRGSEVV